MSKAKDNAVANLLGLVILLIVAGFTGCTRKDKTSALLQGQGYSNISTNWRPLSCDTTDWYRTGFKATLNGKEVNGVVCEGLLFKDQTIRFD